MDKQLFRDTDRLFVSYFKSFIDKSTSVVLTGHKSPDDDCVASLLTLYTYLKDYLGYEKEVRMIITGQEQTRWSYFKYFEHIEFVDDLADEITEKNTLVLLDGSQWFRFSNKEEIKSFKGTSVCIDHHVSSGNNFSLSLIAPQYSSNTEILYKLFFVKESITKELAETMLMGILGDTGNFRYINHENSGVLSIAERLMKAGEVNIQLLESKYRGVDKKILPVFREYLKNTNFIRVEGWPLIAYSYISKSFIEKNSDLIVNQTKFLVLNYLENFRGVDCFFIVRPNEEYTRISIRSKGDLDVNKIMEDLKIGGGHKNAAGGVIKGSPRKMISLMKKYFSKNPFFVSED